MDYLYREIKAMDIRDALRPVTDDENSIGATIHELIETNTIPSIKRESKNEETARKKLEEGNKIISSAPLEKLIEIYSEAIAYALPGSELLARGFANRSAALTNGGMYEDSLKDIERAFEVGYPDNLKAKLYARKAKNLLALNPKMRSEVDDVINQAKIWVEKTDYKNKKKVKKSLEQLKTDKSFKKPFKFWDSSELLPITPNDNPKILRASGSIDIENSGIFGRHIVATKDIKAGETIMVHRFYAFTLKSEYRYRCCWNCSRPAWSSVPCTQCSNVIYCNKECRDTAWQNHHDIECPAITAILAYFEFHDFGYSCLLSLRLLVKALKEFGTIDALYEKVKQINSLHDPVLKLFTGTVYDDTKYASVYSLFRLTLNSMSSIKLSIGTILFLLSGTTEILGGRYDDDPTEMMNDKWAVFIGNLMYRHIEIIQTNAVKMLLSNREGNSVNHGMFLAPLLSLCSHSCDRNIYSLRTGEMNTEIAIQPIKRGQQICISYGITYQKLPAVERRQFIQRSYGFSCQCTACVNGWGPNYRFPPCANLPKKTDNELFMISIKCGNHISIIDRHLKRSAKEITARKVIEMIADFSAMLNLLGGDKYPCREMVAAKIGLINLLTCIREDI